MRYAVGYIACHDGELPSTGLMLARHYRTPDSVAALLRGGDLLALGATPEASRYDAHRPKDAAFGCVRDEDVFYARERGLIQVVYLAVVRAGRVFWNTADGGVRKSVPSALRELGAVSPREFMEMAR